MQRKQQHDMPQETDITNEQKTHYQLTFPFTGINFAIVVIFISILIAGSVTLAISGYIILPLLLAAFAITGGTYALTSFYRVYKTGSERLRKMEGISGDQEEIIASFSHKIREPLNDLVIIGEMLSEKESSKENRELIEALMASTANMVSTVNQLSVNSALPGLTVKRKNIRFSLLPAIQNTIDLLRHKEIRNIEINLSSTSEGNGELLGDPVIMKQIVLSILNNLLQTYRGETSSIMISTLILRSTVSKVTFGISVKGETALFKDLLTGTEKSVTGKLITEAGGKYRSVTAGEETEFTFSLSFVKVPGESDRPEASPKIIELKREEKRVRKELKEIDILLVEDNEINRRITLLTLKPLVKSIDTAANGREALDKLAASPYDIILMDIQMPVMNGLVASEKIRSLERSTQSRVPIIAITANAMLGDKEKCIASGMDAYISKPFQPAQLIAIIKKFL